LPKQSSNRHKKQENATTFRQGRGPALKRGASKTTSVKLDQDVWWKAKRYAFDHRISLSELLDEALIAYMKLEVYRVGRKIGRQLGRPTAPKK
jgi:hypothetical protein